MENIFLFFVIALFILAVADLAVGVGNDAVNFLNSAIGSKVASFRVILFIASIGVLVGATFSSGMMEIARSGIFNPDQFYFSEIMIIFLAVMLADMILLDGFNTLGLQTSTTVSIVFELLGAAVAVAFLKTLTNGEGVQAIGQYINSGRALAIISAILLSVVISFTVGTLVMFFARLLFTFQFQKRVPHIGAIWGGLSVSAIVYFLLLKGASGASFMTPEILEWLDRNTWKLMLFCFFGLTLLFQFLFYAFRTNVLRIIILTGTFALAMAFASNDLVNFIGVPLAGLESYMLFLSDTSVNPGTFTMESLLEPVQTPTIFLAIAGFIMIIALVFSKKARSVTQTEIDLARQTEGYERFSSSALSRSILRFGLQINKFFIWLVPEKTIQELNKRFTHPKKQIKGDDVSKMAYFDQVRASVNLVVASSLIALATSLTLPLSTTYVTFMVAMGTSLSDRAWGRESAVYRISGVITVIGGWFVTAFAAFSIAFFIAMIISWGGVWAAAILVLIGFGIVFKTYQYHKVRARKRQEYDEKETRKYNGEDVMQECKQNIVHTLSEISVLYNQILLSFFKEDRKKLKKAGRRVKALNSQTKELKRDVYIILKKLEEDSIETGHYYVQILDYLREIAHCLTFIAEPIQEHLENNHPTVIPEQEKELLEVNLQIMALLEKIIKVLENDSYRELEPIARSANLIIDELTRLKKFQIKLIKAEKVGTKNSLIIFNLLAETKNLLLFTINMLKAHRDFVILKNGSLDQN